MFSPSRAFMIIPPLLLLLAGCGQPGLGSGESPPESSPIASARPSSPVPESPPTEAAKIRNDLKSGKLSHRLTASDIEVKVNYATSLPIAEWTATTTKPFQVSATASGLGEGQLPKIYLSKLTLSMDTRDDTEPVEPPLPLTDEAAIVPGFLLSAPASYGQEFFLPSFVRGTRSLTLRIRYELLLEQPGESGAETKDYSRRTVTDIVVVPIAAD